MNYPFPPPRHGVLFINIGSPSSLQLQSVANYLRKFLSDCRVIDINPVFRFPVGEFTHRALPHAQFPRGLSQNLA